jgi:hypothetical protein
MSDELITYVIGQLRGACWEEEAAAVEALVKERDEALAAQPYTYIGKDMKPILARDLEAAKDAAEAKLTECEARLGKAIEALRKIADYTHIGESGQGVKQHAEARIASAVLAELEGGEEATGTAWRGRE